MDLHAEKKAITVKQTPTHVHVGVYVVNAQAELCKGLHLIYYAIVNSVGFSFVLPLMTKCHCNLELIPPQVPDDYRLYNSHHQENHHSCNCNSCHW